MTLDEGQGFHLVMPCAGAASLSCDGKGYDLRSGRSALLLPNMRRVTISGLSARAPHYPFRARFNCSPMEWQRRERMLEVQNRLMSLAPGQTITTLAHAMGVLSSAAFATLYLRYIGETP